MRERWSEKLQFGFVFVLFVVGFLFDVLFPRYASGTTPTGTDQPSWVGRGWQRLRRGITRRLWPPPPRQTLVYRDPPSAH